MSHYLENNRFTYNGQRYSVSFISSYRNESDYRIEGMNTSKRFSVDHSTGRGIPAFYGKAYEKGSLQRAAYAAMKRALMIEYSLYAKRQGYKNRGTFLNAVHRS